MGNKDVIFIIILVFLIINHVSNAELLLNSRKLAASLSNTDPNVTVSPNVSPLGGTDKGTDEDKKTSPPSTSEEKKPKDEQVINATLPAKPPTSTKQLNDSPKTPNEEVKDNSNDNTKEKVKEDNKNPTEVKESCDGLDRRCKDENVMVACIKSFNAVSKEVVLLIQNKGEDSLKVSLTFSSSGNKEESVEIQKLQTEQVNISLADLGGNEIKLNAGNGYCVLHPVPGVPVFQGNFFQLDPAYSKFMTPTYGAYLMLLVTLITGGVCAICWFSKRKRSNEVPYQELEMSMPESASGVNTTEGWDEVWDDDWDDEEKAVKSLGSSISGNGLTSRTLKKGGSEDWDD